MKVSELLYFIRITIFKNVKHLLTSDLGRRKQVTLDKDLVYFKKNTYRL